jgi:hypothetical protein
VGKVVENVDKERLVEEGKYTLDVIYEKTNSPPSQNQFYRALIL